MSNKYHLYLNFKRHDSDNSSCLHNAFIQVCIWISEGFSIKSPFIHVEISLQKNNEFPTSYFCNHIKGVSGGDRCFTSNTYENPMEFDITKETYKKTKKFLDDQLGKEFNHRGYFWNFLPIIRNYSFCNVDTKGESYFCVELVAHALIVADILEDTVKPYNITAQDLYNIVKPDYISNGLNFNAMKILNNK